MKFKEQDPRQTAFRVRMIRRQSAD